MSNYTRRYSVIIQFLFQKLHLYDLKSPIGFERLPSEIVSRIFKLLPPKAKREASLVNKRWYSLAMPSLYYAPSIYRQYLRGFIKCLYYSDLKGIDYHNGCYVRELELNKPGGRKQQVKTTRLITVFDVAYLLETVPNLTSLVVHSEDTHLGELVYKAIRTCRPLHPMKKVDFHRPLLDHETDLRAYNIYNLGTIFYSNFMVMHYYRASLD